MQNPENRLVIATKNPGKIREISILLAHLPYSLVFLDTFSNIEVPEESGSTYEENALIKANAVGDATGLVTIADDSGLEVDALPGKLGVRSARDIPGTAQEKNVQLLKDLKDVKNRIAKYVCCVVLYDPQTKQHKVFNGTVEGTIALQEQGVGLHGFGFDPLFVPDGFSQSFGELDDRIKNEISHRAKALKKLADYLTNKGGNE